MQGGSEHDTLYGGPGNDVLDPGGGATSFLRGEAGRDRILLRRVMPGDEHWVDGGAGRDLLDLRHVPAAPGFTGVGARLFRPGYVFPVNCAWADSGLMQCYSAGGASSNVRDVENVTGSPGSDWLWGDERDNVLRGQAGDDLIMGYPGNDRLRGGAGNDDLRGSTGDDLLFGGPADDRLIGEEGTDEANGGPGADTCSAETSASC